MLTVIIFIHDWFRQVIYRGKKGILKAWFNNCASVVDNYATSAFYIKNKSQKVTEKVINKCISRDYV